MTAAKKVWATLLTKPAYLQGALILSHTLARHKSAYPLIVLATADLPPEARAVLAFHGIPVRDIDPLRPKLEGKYMEGPDGDRFADTWTKLRVFEVDEYERIVLLDSDMLVTRNMDELMDLPLARDSIAAAHACACNPRKFKQYPKDWIPANCAHTSSPSPTSPPVSPRAPSPPAPRPWGLLNSGLVVLHPSRAVAEEVYTFMYTDERVPGFSFPDQDLLAAFFAGRWESLNWRYNALKTLRGIHPNEWRDGEVRNVHYILNKPWSARPHASLYPPADYPPTSQAAPATDEPHEDITHGWWWAEWDAFKREFEGVEGAGVQYVGRWVAGEEGYEGAKGGH